MRKIILTMGAILCFGVLSAQTEKSKTASLKPPTEKERAKSGNKIKITTPAPTVPGTSVKGTPAPGTPASATANGSNRPAGSTPPSSGVSTGTPQQNTLGTPETTPPPTR
ncbi:hypothetical protein [Flavobacterium silvaticum]|uniref:Proteophosphoglycan ppg4 n=1 Tax=Flavobacterium silvaticum TaxID=1852020 RepID=A0A972JE79_9FLAO|nr:hypothetical protein [Flavobacterium silvaticum]NMH26579.1 hypothetical protein [Flavobacterium silvaticum]